MTEVVDHLSGELSIEASLTENGIKASAKSRFVNAIDRMFGGLFDVPAAFLEGKASQRRIEDALRKKATEQRAQLRLDNQLDLDKLEAVAALASRREQLEHVLNKAAVTVAALEDMSSSASNDADQGQIDDDWLNIFGLHAGNASSERARVLWGRILSGEIRKPGSFSLITLRVLSELDQRTANTFQRVVSGVYQNMFLIKKGELQGVDLVEATYLEEAGLLQEASGTLNLTQTFDSTGTVAPQNNSAALIIRGQAGTQFQVPVISISRAGQEILSILPKEGDDVSLRALAEHAKPFSESIDLVMITGRPSLDTISYAPLEKLK